VGTLQRLAPIVLTAACAAACGSASRSPASPTVLYNTDLSPATAISGPCTIGFEGLQGNRVPFDAHTACGLAINGSGASWQSSTTYGNPAPFIQFIVPGGTTVSGDVTLQSSDGAFTFASVDVYSSTTKIPYEITGTAHGSVAFSLQGVQGNTFGNFATIMNPHAATPIDHLLIRLTNPAAPCCTNPVGLDNIHVVR
jgi:hypothetical protein